MEEHKTIISTPDYTGENRRSHCYCHPKHEKVLQDHTDALKEFRAGAQTQRDRQEVQHNLMWTDIKGKVEKKLFYIFVGITVGILGFVYNAVHQVDKSVAVLNTNVQLHFEQSKEIKAAIEKVNVKVNQHIMQTRHMINGTKPTTP